MGNKGSGLLADRSVSPLTTQELCLISAAVLVSANRLAYDCSTGDRLSTGKD